MESPATAPVLPAEPGAPSSPIAHVVPAATEEKPTAPTSEPVVIAPPEPVPPVSMVDVKADKIHG